MYYYDLIEAEQPSGGGGSGSVALVGRMMAATHVAAKLHPSVVLHGHLASVPHAAAKLLPLIAIRGRLTSAPHAAVVIKVSGPLLHGRLTSLFNALTVISSSGGPTKGGSAFQGNAFQKNAFQIYQITFNSVYAVAAADILGVTVVPPLTAALSTGQAGTVNLLENQNEPLLGISAQGNANATNPTETVGFVSGVVGAGKALAPNNTELDLGISSVFGAGHTGTAMPDYTATNVVSGIFATAQSQNFEPEVRNALIGISGASHVASISNADIIGNVIGINSSGQVVGFGTDTNAALRDVFATAVALGTSGTDGTANLSSATAQGDAGEMASQRLLTGVFASGEQSPITAVLAGDSPTLIGVSADAAAYALAALPSLSSINAVGFANQLPADRTLASAVASGEAGEMPYFYSRFIGVSAIGGATLVTIFSISYSINNAIIVHGAASINIAANGSETTINIIGGATKNLPVS